MIHEVHLNFVTVHSLANEKFLDSDLMPESVSVQLLYWARASQKNWMKLHKEDGQKVP